MQQLNRRSVNYAQTESGQIPNEWQIRYLSDVCTLLKDGSHYSPFHQDTGYPLATVTNMKDTYIDIQSCYRISKQDYDQLVRNKCNIEKGDVLFSKDGTIGLSLVYNQHEPIVVLSSIAIIRPKHEILDSYYLSYSLRSALVMKKILGSKTGTALTRIILKDIRKAKIPLPPIKEQKKIASILLKVDELVQKTDQIIKQSQRLRKGLMQKLLTSGIGHTKFKNVTLFPRYSEETIPDDWSIDRLGDLITIIDYRGRTPRFSSNGIPHLRSNNIRYGKLNIEDLMFVSEKTYKEYMTRGIPKENDVLFTTEGPLGEVALVPKDFRFSVAQRIIVLRPYVTKILPQFLKHMLLDRKVRKRYFALATGTTLGGIASKWFTKILLPYPRDILEQKMISNSLDMIEQQITYNEMLFFKYKYLKKGMMQKLLTGKIRITV